MQLGTTQQKLKAIGVETAGVVNTPLTRAQLYFKYRPMRVLLAADPEAATHRAFRVPAGALVENESEASWSQGKVTMGQLLALKLNPMGELFEPQNPFAAMETVNKRDGFEPDETDQQIASEHGMQLTGHFLIDRQGIIRWGHIEALERMELADCHKLPACLHKWKCAGAMLAIRSDQSAPQ